MKVTDILTMKGPVVITIRPSQTIGTLSEQLREKRIGAAVVSNDGHTIDGVISERDIAYGLAVHKADLHTLPVSALMTTVVVTCSPHDSVANVASTMLTRNVRHLPVVDDGRLAGMISIRDVLRLRLEDLQRQNSELRAFVSHADSVPAQDR